MIALALLVFTAFPAPATSTKAMAATAHPLATRAALEIIDDGGNAIDAAVAAAFVVSVVEPFSAGIGGGGFAVVHLEHADGKSGAHATKAIDFRERAPALATRDMYVDPTTHAVVEGRSVDGHLAVAVPGTVAGLFELHKTYGKLPWRRVLRPAIDIARDGFAVGDQWVGAFDWRKDVLTRFAPTREAFMKPSADTAHDADHKGELVPLARGDRLRQRDLAKTLREIADDPRAFYEGKIAVAIADEMKKGGGLVTLDDLKGYRPQWRDPLCGTYEDVELCTMPPPSSGGVHVLEILNLLHGTDLKKLGWHHVDAVHTLVESMRIAFADRAVYLGDPSFVDVPTKTLISMEYADKRRKEIDPKKAKKSVDVKAASPELLKSLGKESHDTSHLSVVDKDRNAVSLTFTVNYGFGSGVVVPGTGVLLNDEMDDFAAAPGVPNKYGLVGGEANSVQPGKIPLSSMTPLVATKGGHFFLAAGSPGGSTIITTVLQTILHVVDYGMDAQAAVAAPRIHEQWLPDTVRVERFGLDEATIAALTARGHALTIVDESWGNAMCIVQRTDGTLEGGADPRGEGLAAGL